MKFKLFLIVFLSSFLAQSQTKEEIKDFFGKTMPIKQQIQFLKNNKNESAVIIYKNQNFRIYQ